MELNESCKKEMNIHFTFRNGLLRICLFYAHFLWTFQWLKFDSPELVSDCSVWGHSRIMNIKLNLNESHKDLTTSVAARIRLHTNVQSLDLDFIFFLAKYLFVCLFSIEKKKKCHLTNIKHFQLHRFTSGKKKKIKKKYFTKDETFCFNTFRM